MGTDDQGHSLTVIHGVYANAYCLIKSNKCFIYPEVRYSAAIFSKWTFQNRMFVKKYQSIYSLSRNIAVSGQSSSRIEPTREEQSNCTLGYMCELVYYQERGTDEEMRFA